MNTQNNISKLLAPFLTLFLIGMITGGAIVFSYYNYTNSKSPPEKEGNLAVLNFDPGDYQDEAAAYVLFRATKESFMPSGVPGVYGEELNISFDAVQEAINMVAPFGPTYGEEGKKIILTGADLERYINIGFQTACEYCCEAKTLVFENGEAACGCAHSQMMRGLAAYLIQNHPELSDEQILEELNLWKRTYFPKITLSAKLQELEKSGEPGITELLEEFPDFLLQMVGDC